MEIEIEQEIETLGPDLAVIDTQMKLYRRKPNPVTFTTTVFQAFLSMRRLVEFEIFRLFDVGEDSKEVDLKRKAEELAKTFSYGGKIDWDLYKKALQLLRMLKEEAEPPSTEEDKEQEAIPGLEPAMANSFKNLRENEKKQLEEALRSRILNSESRIFLRGLFRLSRRAERLKWLVGKRDGGRKDLSLPWNEHLLELSALMENLGLKQEKIAHKQDKLKSVVCKRNALRKEYNAQRDELKELFPELVELERIQDECLFELTLQLFHLVQENRVDVIHLNAPSLLKASLLDGRCGATAQAFAGTITRGYEEGQFVNLPILV